MLLVGRVLFLARPPYTKLRRRIRNRVPASRHRTSGVGHAEMQDAATDLLASRTSRSPHLKRRLEIISSAKLMRILAGFHDQGCGIPRPTYGRRQAPDAATV